MPLDPERWTRADALFEAALERPEPEREAFLAHEAEDDPEILQTVRSLLEALGESERSVGESAAALVTMEPEAEDSPLPEGTTLGPWRVLGEIGRGGMGTVYLAERSDGAFDRTVAIKVVRTGPGTVTRGRRFLAERRILAALEHPGIARLYDSGATGDGRPFLVMEHVSGTRIDAWADERRLDLAARLRLFSAVCSAVAYAHRHLVVHRDLKPANVLVTESGDVKLLDFGIARLLDVDADEPATRMSQRLLTPEYAAPEQVRGDPVTAEADVYSLGVMLCELLCGRRPPWQRQVILGVPASDVAAALVPPSRMATAVGDDGASPAQIAAARGMSPDRLSRRLAGDLDTVVLTALAPDPADRYPTVDALREDVERVLGARPIEARPTPILARARKFATRHRGATTATLLALVLAVGYVVTLAVQSHRIATERDRAETALRRSEQVVELLAGLFEASDPLEPVRRDTLRVAGFLEEGVARVERDLADEPAVQSELFLVLASVQRAVGRVEEAASLAERSVALRRADPSTPPVDLAHSLIELGQSRIALSELDAAEGALMEALDLQRGFLPDDVGLRATVLEHLGYALLNGGQLDSARVVLLASLDATTAADPVDSLTLSELYNRLAVVAQRSAQYDSALALTRRASEIEMRLLGPDHPKTLVNRINEGFLTDRMGRPADAVPGLREVVELARARVAPDHPLIPNALMTLGRALMNSGDLDGARIPVEQAVAINRTRLGGRHLDLAITLDYLSTIELRQGRFREGEAALAEAYGLFAGLLGPENPNAAIGRVRWAEAQCDARRADPRIEEGLANFDAGLVIVDAVFPESHPQRVNGHVWRGACLARAGRTAEAEAELTEWYEIAVRDLAVTEQARRNAVRELGDLLERRGEPARAAEVRANG